MSEEEFLKKLGERIVQLREKKGLRQIDLSDKLGMEDSSLRRIERGRTNTSIMMLRRISVALDVKLEDLLKGLK